jgi:hypothetical protein
VSQPGGSSRWQHAAGAAFVGVTILGPIVLALLAILALPLVVAAFPLTITFVTLALAAAFAVHVVRQRRNREHD